MEQTSVTDIKTLKILVFTQIVLVCALGLKKFIEWAFHKRQAEFDDKREEKKHEETTLDDVMRQLLKIAPTVGKIEAQMLVFEPYIMGIPRMQKGLVMLFQNAKLEEPKDEKK